MKGACDGGLFIPHNEKRFPGYHIQKAEVVTNKKGKKLEETEKAKAAKEVAWSDDLKDIKQKFSNFFYQKPEGQEVRI